MKNVLTVILSLLVPSLLFGQQIPRAFEHIPELKNYSAFFTSPPKDSALSLSGIASPCFKVIDSIQLNSLCRTDSALLESIIDSACLCGKITGKDFIGFVIKYKGGAYNMWRSTFLYVYEKNTGSCQEIKLDFLWAAEGGEGTSESWLLDYNDDGKADILRKDLSLLIAPDHSGDVQFSKKEKYHLLIWETNSFKEVKINDLHSLQKRFRMEMP